MVAVTQNVRVLAVGNDYIGTSRKQDDDFENVGVITLPISVEEVQKFL
jgi:hypothetical protein